MEQQAQDAQADAALQQVALQLNQGLVVQRQALFDAAKRYAQKKQAGSTLLANTTPAPVANRPKII